MCWMPPAAGEEPGNVQGRYRVGIVEGSSGVNIRGKFVLSRNLGCKTKGVAMWLNIVPNDLRVAYS